MSQNFFTLVNSLFVGTPENLEACMKLNAELLHRVYDEQVYLLDMGVPFDYTDSLSSSQRMELIMYTKEYREILNKREENKIL